MLNDDLLNKPQYVDFRNPLLVDLFSRMTEKLQKLQVILEERLPEREAASSPREA